MDLLIDTHVFIWFLNGDDQLPASIKDLISDTSNRCLLSIRDPFDRMIIAQAQVENLPLATNDEAFHSYRISILWK